MDRITPQRFHKYKETFRKEIDHSPAECFVVFKILVSKGGFADFTGDSKRIPDPKLVRCLYIRQVSERTRNKFGFDTGVTGVVWVSPYHLQKAGAPLKFSTQDVHIELFGEKYGCSSIIYRAPYYGSYIAAELQLRDYREM